MSFSPHILTSETGMAINLVSSRVISQRRSYFFPCQSLRGIMNVRQWNAHLQFLFVLFFDNTGSMNSDSKPESVLACHFNSQGRFFFGFFFLFFLTLLYSVLRLRHGSFFSVPPMGNLFPV